MNDDNAGAPGYVNVPYPFGQGMRAAEAADGQLANLSLPDRVAMMRQLNELTKLPEYDAAEDVTHGGQYEQNADAFIRTLDDINSVAMLLPWAGMAEAPAAYALGEFDE